MELCGTIRSGGMDSTLHPLKMRMPSFGHFDSTCWMLMLKARMLETADKGKQKGLSRAALGLMHALSWSRIKDTGAESKMLHKMPERIEAYRLELMQIVEHLQSTPHLGLTLHAHAPLERLLHAACLAWLNASLKMKSFADSLRC